MKKKLTKTGIKTLRAVSLLEMIVVLLITSIVINIAYWSMQIFHQQIQLFTQHHEELLSKAELQMMLLRDFYKAEKIYRIDDKRLQINYHQQQIVYTFAEQQIIRKTAIQNYHTTFEQIKQLKMQFKQAEAAVQSPIDLLSFHLCTPLDTTYYLFSKKYAADFLMEQAQRNK